MGVIVIAHDPTHTRVCGTQQVFVVCEHDDDGGCRCVIYINSMLRCGVGEIALRAQLSSSPTPQIFVYDYTHNTHAAVCCRRAMPTVHTTCLNPRAMCAHRIKCSILTDYISIPAHIRRTTATTTSFALHSMPTHTRSVRRRRRRRNINTRGSTLRSTIRCCTHDDDDDVGRAMLYI